MSFDDLALLNDTLRRYRSVRGLRVHHIWKPEGKGDAGFPNARGTTGHDG
jgi:hypothetical protein